MENNGPLELVIGVEWIKLCIDVSKHLANFLQAELLQVVCKTVSAP